MELVLRALLVLLIFLVLRLFFHFEKFEVNGILLLSSNLKTLELCIGFIIDTWNSIELKTEPCGTLDTINKSSHPELFLGKRVLKYAANLQENTHAEVRFNLIRTWPKLLDIFYTDINRVGTCWHKQYVIMDVSFVVLWKFI